MRHLRGDRDRDYDHDYDYDYDHDQDRDQRPREGLRLRLLAVVGATLAFVPLVPGSPPLPLCPLCDRPNHYPSDHHLVPKSRGGRVTTTLCRDCHRAIHATFSNKELERTYSTREALLAHDAFRRMVEFISRQDPGGKVRMRPSRRRPRR